MNIRLYQSADRQALENIMIELQRHIAELDPHKRNRMPEDFDAIAYVDQLIGHVERDHGLIFIACDDHEVGGFIAGSIPDEGPDDLLDHYPAKEGKIIELVVSQEHRGQGTGHTLMEKMEEYFRQKDCEYIRVGCFAPNTGTHLFYEKCGYADRYVEMLKKII